MNRSGPVAILQIIPNHHNLLPTRLLKALAMLDERGHPYGFYDIERSPERDYRTALVELFASIKEETVLVSMACHNNYPKIESLIFLYLYLPLLKGKKVIICSPYFSFYDASLIERDNIVFSLLEIDDFISQEMDLPVVDDDVFLNRLEGFLTRYGYQDYRLWSYLTFGCLAECSFCYNRLPFKGAPKVTRCCPDTVLKWMKAGSRLGKVYCEFSEPNFLADRAFAIEFLERLKHENPGVSWRCKTRLDDIDPKTYALMIAAGCQTIFFGFEHVDLSVLKNIHKGENSLKQLKKFLTYRQENTAIQLSFMTGIHGETPDMLRHNLDVLTRLSLIPGVEPNLGWNTLFDRYSRRQTFPNFIVAFMYIMNMLPSRWQISPSLMKDILSLCIREPFFDFLCVTETERSLELMQQLFVYIKSHSQPQLVRDFHRLMEYEGAVLLKLILKSRSLEELNSGVLSAMGVKEKELCFEDRN